MMNWILSIPLDVIIFLAMAVSSAVGYGIGWSERKTQAQIIDDQYKVIQRLEDTLDGVISNEREYRG